MNCPDDLITGSSGTLRFAGEAGGFAELGEDPKWKMIPFATVELGESQNQVDSQLISDGRNPSEPSLGNRTASGSVKIAVDTKGFPLFLLAAMGDYSYKDDTGGDSKKHIHTFKIKNSSVCSMCVEKGFDPSARFYRIRGAKVADFKLDFGGEGEVLATFSFNAKYEEASQHMGAAAVATLTNGAAIAVNDDSFAVDDASKFEAGKTLVFEGDENMYVVKEVSGNNVVLEKGVTAEIADGKKVYCNNFQGESLADAVKFDQFQVELASSDPNLKSVKSYSLTFSNEAEGSTTIDDKGMTGVIADGVAKVSGNLSLLYRRSTETLLQAVREKKPVSMTNRLVDNASGDKIEFIMEEVLLSGQSPKITTPKGIEISLDYRAFLKKGTEGSALVVKVYNDQPSYLV